MRECCPIFDMSDGTQLEIRSRTSRNVASRFGDLRPAGRKRTGELFLREKEKRERPTLFVHLPPALSDQRIIAVISIGPQSLAPFVRVACLPQYFACVLLSKGHSGCKKLLNLNIIYLFLWRNYTWNLNLNLLGNLIFG